MEPSLNDVYMYLCRGESFIALEMIEKGVYTLGIAVSREEIQQVTREVMGQAKEINRDMFEKIIERVRNKSQKIDVKELFEVLDEDRDGIVTKKMLKHYLCSFGEKMIPEAVEELFNARLPKQDNLNYNDFCLLLS